ncbi:MAG TPA: hypothetical protein VGJ95_13775 [Pseudonocardiaceae bacterium]|jgi:hypothetical protein
MADDRVDPIASTGAFRAFSADRHADDAPTGRRPSTLVVVTAIVALAALVVGILAVVL